MGVRRQGENDPPSNNVNSLAESAVAFSVSDLGHVVLDSRLVDKEGRALTGLGESIAGHRIAREAVGA